MPQISAIAKIVELLGGTKRHALFAYAKTQIGQTKSGVKAPILLGCVEAVNRVFEECFGAPIDGSVGTTALFNHLSNDPRFQKTSEPLEGDIIISYGHRTGPVSSGHVGIISDGSKIMSNNSLNGKWDEHLNIELWKHRYAGAGYEIFYFRLI